jgi:predicted metalloendopeptidase
MRTTAVSLAVLLTCPAAFADEKSSLACTDFYTYVNDAWLKRAQIAPDRTGASTFEGQ